MKDNKNKGFSLVELIIVIVIIAVIVALLLPQFIKQVERSKEAKDLQDIEEYKTAVETMILDDRLPSGDVTLEVDADTGTLVTNLPADTAKAYGLEEELILSSKKWKDFKWTMDGNDYDWTLSGEDLSGAQYFTPLGKTKNPE
ncbi:MAG: prepilin-type N-terminal cleavage/methylation domain-containing protein [Lachnospiraceae bacterium]|nr:prepilin-type N-terminal cleavage/methylation domain-containing protein [Lachnospiraceae bacterium]